uniref:Plastocyanin-like domain-containing protein n=1 Tax=Gossypium raimondii TaxID=29730 RepID=A0A0D2S8J8_GOSRA|nr:hypothetical protein B456_009G261200 [Gossypium raimondii]
MAAFQGLRFGFAEGTQFLSTSTIKETMLYPSSGNTYIHTCICLHPLFMMKQLVIYIELCLWVFREGVKGSIDGSNELIQPGTNFTYKIELKGEIGTLWWHATSAWAAATVHGAFVISPAANEDYPFPAPTSDQTIILGQWFKQELTEGDKTIAPGRADAYTINGHPGETYGCSNDTTFEMQVDYEGLYLVRVINAVVNETMVFAVASHSFTIVGQNGAYTKRSFTNSLTLAPAQVVDVLLCANVNVGHYYITARPSSGTYITNGILRYLTTSS